MKGNERDKKSKIIRDTFWFSIQTFYFWTDKYDAFEKKNAETVNAWTQSQILLCGGNGALGICNKLLFYNRSQFNDCHVREGQVPRSTLTTSNWKQGNVRTKPYQKSICKISKQNRPPPPFLFPFSLNQ